MCQHVLYVPVVLDELQSLLGSDAVDTLVEIRPHEDADVDQLLPVDPQCIEELPGLYDLGLHVPVDVLAGDLPPSGDGDVPQEPGRSEEQ